MLVEIGPVELSEQVLLSAPHLKVEKTLIDDAGIPRVVQARRRAAEPA
jgi:hypothetical protein